MKNILLSAILVFCIPFISAQNISPEILTRQWGAKWITVPGASASGYGVYLFRKTIDIPTVPDSFIVHVSGDNRYKLYVNEQLVSVGPARGDYYYWNYETINLTPYLTNGRNIIAAKVWNEGDLRPEAQISWRTGFILQGNSATELALNTDISWRCLRDNSYEPYTSHDVIGYFVVGPGEYVDMRKHMSGWNKPEFDDSSWKNAELSTWRGGSPKGTLDAFGWMLVPSSIPAMEMNLQRLQTTRESTGAIVPDAFPATNAAFTIPQNTKATILLDQGYLTNAYITLLFGNGKDASLTLKYAEALFIPAQSKIYGTNSGGYMGSPEIAGKGNRNEIREKLFLGRKDSLISDGTLHQEFTSLYWRTYRYILLTVETKEDPLIIEDIYGTFTGYPFKMNAGFNSNNKDLDKILEIGWRTARLCATETYMDCPYYEQLQYIGDTRIQALISFYNSGDDRLVRNALNLMDHSRISEGPTLSRHPSYSPQLIPTFSLWYIGMLHDYWMYRPDSLFVKEKLSGTRQILEFFNRYQQADGSLKNVPYWNFTDWVGNAPGWSAGVPPVDNEGNSSVLDLQLLWAYQIASELESNMGMEAFAGLYRTRAEMLMHTIKQKYWDNLKGMFADTPEKKYFSQHANTLAILTGIVSEVEAIELAKKIMTNQDLTPASIYFKFYLHQAYVKAGFGNDYLNWLGKWYENIQMGMTTWAEDSEISTARSDCHAWGASPNIEFYRVVLGINAGAPGFSKVRVEPHLGNLQKVSGEIPHPLGSISVKYLVDKGKLNVEIRLPSGLDGTFVWKGKEYELKEGENKFGL